MLQGFKFQQKEQEDGQMTYLCQYNYMCTDSNVEDIKTVKNEWTQWGYDLSVDVGSINFLVF